MSVNLSLHSNNQYFSLPPIWFNYCWGCYDVIAFRVWRVMGPCVTFWFKHNHELFTRELHNQIRMNGQCIRYLLAHGPPSCHMRLCGLLRCVDGLAYNNWRLIVVSTISVQPVRTRWLKTSRCFHPSDWSWIFSMWRHHFEVGVTDCF